MSNEPIAEGNYTDILWDTIVSIEYIGYEHVYDIEVEGTHNFIGNGIFAHNTYINGNLTATGVISEAGTALGSKYVPLAGGVNITGGLNIATTSGNVGIGTTAPNYKLDVAGGDLALQTSKKVILDSNDTGDTYMVHDSVNDRVSIYVDGIEMVRINK